MKIHFSQNQPNPEYGEDGLMKLPDDHPETDLTYTAKIESSGDPTLETESYGLIEQSAVSSDGETLQPYELSNSEVDSLYQVGISLVETMRGEMKRREMTVTGVTQAIDSKTGEVLYNKNYRRGHKA